MSATLLKSAPHTASLTVPPVARSIGRVLFAITILFLTFDTAVKLIQAPFAVEGTVKLGFGADQVFPLGVICLVCLVLYVIPRTAPFGALLWTGYFGGAIATHLRLRHPLLSETIFPIYVAVIMWAALYLRDQRVRALLRPSADSINLPSTF